ncbi:unnamed protein product [Hermetia illucens]|uniref:Uncharacterized protein n=1 Tax=Hermetia illucens TaxID=343691 RepID=A0A7R8UUU1_HERIL|nr:unnamed protein product [Hermetia illucens]
MPARPDPAYVCGAPAENTLPYAPWLSVGTAEERAERTVTDNSPYLQGKRAALFANIAEYLYWEYLTYENYMTMCGRFQTEIEKLFAIDSIHSRICREVGHLLVLLIF